MRISSSLINQYCQCIHMVMHMVCFVTTQFLCLLHMDTCETYCLSMDLRQTKGPALHPLLLMKNELADIQLALLRKISPLSKNMCTTGVTMHQCPLSLDEMTSKRVPFADRTTSCARLLLLDRRLEFTGGADLRPNQQSRNPARRER